MYGSRLINRSTVTGKTLRQLSSYGLASESKGVLKIEELDIYNFAPGIYSLSSTGRFRFGIRSKFTVIR